MMPPRISAFFLALIFGGCGLIGLDELDGDPISDGIAPFTAGEAVELCIDSRLLIDTESPPGLCEAESREGAACEVDEECDSPESCVCGRCAVRLCTSTADCREGSICAGTPRRCQARCDADEDCGEFGLCEAGACVFACIDHGHCPSGELCLAGRCRAISCGPSGPNCGPGERCVDQIYRARSLHPAALRNENEEEITLFLEVRPYGGGPSEIFRFTGADGVHFTAAPPRALSIVPSGASAVSSPSAIYTGDGSVELYYEVDGGASIARAIDRSGEGEEFAVADGALLRPADYGFGGSTIRAPSIAMVFGRRIIAYETDSGLGLAIERDGSFVGMDAPVLSAADVEDPANFTNVSDLRQPELYVDEGAGGRRILRLYFTANGVAQPVNLGGQFDVPNDSIALAGAVLDEALDAFSFTTHFRNPIFARILNFSPIDEGAPSLTPWAGGYLLYFDGAGGVFVARNPNQ